MKTTNLQILLVTTVGLVAVPSILAQGCGGGPSGHQDAGCCPAAGAAGGCHDAPAAPAAPAASDPHAAHRPSPAAPAPVPNATTSAFSTFSEPAKSVFTGYVQIQAALAQDSLVGVSEAAGALAKAVRADIAETFPASVATQADALAKAKDLAAARGAFQPLSASLVQFVKAGKVPAGVLYEIYCPMAKASWLQTDRTVQNPYYGPSMLRCGVVKAG